MEDNRKGTKEPTKVLSSVFDSDGIGYPAMPTERGEVPADNFGFFPKGTEEVPDKEFRSWPEKR